MREYKALAIVIPVFCAILLGSGILMAGNKNAIRQGVTVGGIDLSGMTVPQAETKLQESMKDSFGKQIVLRYNSRRFVIPYDDLGARADLESNAVSAFRVGREANLLSRFASVIRARYSGVNLPLVFFLDKQKAAGQLENIGSQLGVRPVDAKLMIKDGSIIELPSSPGIKLDMDRNLASIEEAVISGSEEVVLVANEDLPAVTSADLQGIDGILASYSTIYKTWQRDRTANLRIACRSIDGTVIPPGGVFSYNKELGPRLKKFGYRDAPIFVNGEVEPGIGGGICQVSTTLYNAVLLADLNIRRRAHHSQPVKYAPIGRDATVAYPSIDFTFENTTDSPIYIMASVGRNTVNINILGRKINGQEVSLVSYDRKVVKPLVKKEIDGLLKPGERIVLEKGRAGQRVTIYRIVKQDGAIVKRELISKNYYRPQNTVIAVPAESDAPLSDNVQ